jgi:hypothetical protein
MFVCPIVHVRVRDVRDANAGRIVDAPADDAFDAI